MKTIELHFWLSTLWYRKSEIESIQPIQEPRCAHVLDAPLTSIIWHRMKLRMSKTTTIQPSQGNSQQHEEFQILHLSSTLSPTLLSNGSRAPMAFNNVLLPSIRLVDASKGLLLAYSAILLPQYQEYLNKKIREPPHDLDCPTRHQAYQTAYSKFSGNLYQNNWVWKVASTSKRKNS
jgi:hypothetical protein